MEVSAIALAVAFEVVPLPIVRRAIVRRATVHRATVGRATARRTVVRCTVARRAGAAAVSRAVWSRTAVARSVAIAVELAAIGRRQRADKFFFGHLVPTRDLVLLGAGGQGLSGQSAKRSDGHVVESPSE